MYQKHHRWLIGSGSYQVDLAVLNGPKWLLPLTLSTPSRKPWNTDPITAHYCTMYQHSDLKTQLADHSQRLLRKKPVTLTTAIQQNVIVVGDHVAQSYEDELLQIPLCCFLS